MDKETHRLHDEQILDKGAEESQGEEVGVTARERKKNEGERERNPIHSHLCALNSGKLSTF